MNRTLNLKLFVDKDAGLSMTVKHTEVVGEPGEKETHSTESTDAWGSNTSLQEGARHAIEDFFGRLRNDAKGDKTPLERVIDETVEHVNSGALDTPDMTVRASKGKAARG